MCTGQTGLGSPLHLERRALQNAKPVPALHQGIQAAAVGVVTLMVTASGVFGEMQAALNKVWKAQPKGTTVGRLVRARAKSLGLVAALGFLLVVSLAVSAWRNGVHPDALLGERLCQARREILDGRYPDSQLQPSADQALL